MAEKTATFSLQIKASSDDVLKGKYDLEKYRDAITSSQNVIKQYVSNLKLLRGSSEDVKKAKIDLKARIDAERDAISRATLQIQNHGKTVKAAAESTGIFSKAIELMSSSSLASKLAVGAMVAAVVAGTVALGDFSLQAIAANRAMMTNLEGTTGSAANAKAFGYQIDALAQKLPIARDRLYELGSSMAETWGQSRITGAGIQASFDAVATVTAGMSERAGSALQSIIDRGKTFGRIGLGYQELRPLGLRIEDVYARIAKNAGRSFKDVQLLSMQGMLDVNAFAQAVKEVSHQRFDPVIGKKMLDLGVIAMRFKQNLVGLFKGANIEGFLGSLSKLVGLFDENTVTGHALQTTISEIAGVFNTLAVAIFPSVEGGLRKFAVIALNMTADVLDGLTSMVVGWNQLRGMDWKAIAAGFTVVMLPAIISIGTAAGTAAIGVGALALSFAPFIAAGTAVGLLVDQIIKLKRETAGVDSSVLMRGSLGYAGGTGAGGGVGTGYTSFAKPHAAGGLVPSRPVPGEFFTSVSPGERILPAGASSDGGGGAGGGSPIEVHFHLSGGGGKEAVAALQTGSVLSLITHAIQTAIRGAGIPTGQAPAT